MANHRAFGVRQNSESAESFSRSRQGPNACVGRVTKGLGEAGVRSAMASRRPGQCLSVLPLLFVRIGIELYASPLPLSQAPVAAPTLPAHSRGGIQGRLREGDGGGFAQVR
jgi:hypothetical protein